MKLFQANNHSISLINYRESDSQTKVTIQKILVEDYDITNTSSIAQVQEAELNSNNFRIVTPTETYLLRRNKPEAEERIRNSHNLILYCQKKCVPVPEIISPKNNLDNNQTYVKKSDYIYTLFRFIEGHHFNGSLEELKELGKGAAKLHCALADYPGKVLNYPPSAVRSPISYSPDEFQKIKEAITLKKDEFQEAVMGEIDFLITISEKITAKIRNDLGNGKIRIQPIHLDLHPHNTLFEGNELKAILDFDSCCISELVRDVSFTLHRAVRQYLVHKYPADCRQGDLTDQMINQEVIIGTKVFLDAYEEINPLTSEEKTLIPYFIQDECLHRIHTLLTKHYFGLGTTWVKDLPKQLTLLKEGKYFLDFISDPTNYLTGIKAIIFDWGGVCCSGADIFSAPVLLKHFNLSAKEINQKARELEEKFARGIISKDEFWPELINQLGLENVTSIAELKNHYLTSYEIYSTVLDLAKKLGQRYALALLSNMNEEMGLQIETAHQIRGIFNPLIFSYKVKMIKPEPEIYYLILKRLNIPAQECLFIDDSQRNIDAATKIGINGIKFINYRQLIKDLAKFGIFI